MYKELLKLFGECLDFISEYKYIKGLEEIIQKIKKLLAAIQTHNLKFIEELTEDVLKNTDFEDVPISKRESKIKNVEMRIKKNGRYVIDRLIFLACKKISMHELEKSLVVNKDLKAAYNWLKLELNKKKTK